MAQSNKRRKTVKMIDGTRLQTDRLWKTDVQESVPLEFSDHVWQLSQALYQAGIARGRALATASGRSRPKKKR